MINVTKPYLPPFKEYSQYLEGIWDRGWVTNHGPLIAELEDRLKEYLEVNYVHVVSSGTVALQIAFKALELQGEVITTAFSYLAGANALLWANCKPVFTDIEEKTLGLDPFEIEAAITHKTSAILATHVFGYPCDVLRIKAIADKYHLKVIYDAAHAFGVNVYKKSIFNYGDVSTASFHATKLFHTIEGGAIFTNDKEIAGKCDLLRSFGVKDTDPVCAGINGKNSEFHAAMGLCNLPKVAEFIKKRLEISLLYKSLLKDLPLKFIQHIEEVDYNYSYFPVLFCCQEKMLRVKEDLYSRGINARRYFFPSLNKLPYFNGANCPVAEDISKRILCLPSYYDLSLSDVEKIAQLIVNQYK